MRHLHNFMLKIVNKHKEIFLPNLNQWPENSTLKNSTTEYSTPKVPRFHPRKIPPQEIFTLDNSIPVLKINFFRRSLEIYQYGSIEREPYQYFLNNTSVFIQGFQVRLDQLDQVLLVQVKDKLGSIRIGCIRTLSGSQKTWNILQSIKIIQKFIAHIYSSSFFYAYFSSFK